MQPPDFDWDDAKCLLAVARHRGMQAAARQLGVNQSTVQRRLADLERALGRPLVRREPAGYRLTEFGEQLLPLAEQLEHAALELARRVATLHSDLAGVVRVTCPDPMVYRLSHSALVERFRELHPEVEVQFVASDAFLDLHKGEADIALRAGGDDDTLVGREVGVSDWAFYASPAYVQRHGRPACIEDLLRHALAGFDDSKAEHKTSRWLRERLPGVRIAARTDNVLGLFYSAKSGVGIAPLPIVLGDPDPDLVQVLPPQPGLGQTWRLLTTPQLRSTPRVAALFEFFVAEIAILRRVLFDPAVFH